MFLSVLQVFVYLHLVSGGLVNRTIGDQLGNSATGLQVCAGRQPRIPNVDIIYNLQSTHSPPGSRSHGYGCSFCFSKFGSSPGSGE